MTRAADLQAVIFGAAGSRIMAALGVAWWLAPANRSWPRRWRLCVVRFRDGLADNPAIVLIDAAGQEPTQWHQPRDVRRRALHLRGLMIALPCLGRRPFGVLLGVFAGVVLFPFVVATDDASLTDVARFAIAYPAGSSADGS
jgi:hypothetical protein